MKDNEQFNSNKQIEEMAFNLIMATSPLGVKDLTKVFDYKTVATDLYNLYGWRKERQGKWLVRGLLQNERRMCFIDHSIKCSNCGFDIEMLQGKRYRYCPNCGAKMKGAE